MRRILPALAATLAVVAAAAADFPPDRAQKVLRYAFERAETTFDPQKTSDVYSNFVESAIFETPLDYDYLARPLRLVPATLAAMPEISADGKTYTLRVKPGIYFTDDPAFKGKRRELIAADYVYSMKRLMDPKLSAPLLGEFEGVVAGTEQAIERARKSGRFDYDAPVEGLKVIDRYTFQIKLNEPFYNFIYNLADCRATCAVAREVVEHYGDDVGSHPVGTGPYKLAFWKRASRIVLEANPDYREEYFHAEATDDIGREILAVQKGKRLPMIGRVEIAIIEEEQPRWLSFVNGEADLAYRVGYQFAPQAMPNGKVAPNLAKRGIRGYPIVETATNFYFFNMDDPVVGGYGPEKVALRRAIGLGIDTRNIIDYAYSGLGKIAQTPVLPHTSAYDPKLKTEFSDHDPARARALLDLYGYVDRNGDGWRDLPDGSPLVMKVATTSVQRDRKIAEVLTKNMKAIGLQVQLMTAQWPEQLKAARAGKLQIWSLALSAAAPDAVGTFARYDSRQIGGQNLARFSLPAFNVLYDKMQTLPDGPERAAAFREAELLSLAYMPYKFTLNRLSIDMAQPQLVGYRRAVFWQDWWQFVDIDNSLRRTR